ncbi:MAG: zinc-ribbon domain-containing protein [Erysipelotrichaceae bacterium]
MYCRKCAEKISDNAKFCPNCGIEVIIIKQKSAELSEKQRKEISQNKLDKKREKLLTELKNPYVIPAIGSAVVAFGLGAFPWPISWGIGTSLWMRILILVVALLASYHSTKARQVNRLYQIEYQYQIKPKMVNAATVLSTITVIVALFSIVTM